MQVHTMLAAKVLYEIFRTIQNNEAISPEELNQYPWEELMPAERDARAAEVTAYLQSGEVPASVDGGVTARDIFKAVVDALR